MKSIQLNNLSLYDIGSKIQMAGALWREENKLYLTLFPETPSIIDDEIISLPLTVSEWEQFIRQSDLMETVILGHDTTGIVKKIVRKCQRQVDGKIQWAVFDRDNYTCRYCGRRGIPLTIDHVILWEQGGPTIIENLITACKPCNGARHSTLYDKWLESESYKKRSENLTEEQKQRNQEVLITLPHLITLTVSVIRSR